MGLVCNVFHMVEFCLLTNTDFITIIVIIDYYSPDYISYYKEAEMEKQLLLLGIMMEGKMHGYQINEYVQHVMSFYTDIKKSTTYFVLEQLEKDGYVTHEVEREGRRPERRVYEITEKGKSQFFDLLRENIGSYTPTHSSDNIGITFLGKLKPSEAKELLKAKKQKIQAEIGKFTGVQDHGVYLKYVLEHSLAYLNADLKWVNSILKNI